jgi:cell division ATPase FtsA
LVGGTANIPGIAEFTKEKLQLAARLGKFDQIQGIIDDIKKPEFITVIGLMQLDMLFAEQMVESSFARQAVSGSILSSVGGLLKRFK